MPQPPQPRDLDQVRADIAALQNDIRAITPIKVMSNPMHIQITALKTTALLLELSDHIARLAPYADEVA